MKRQLMFDIQFNNKLKHNISRFECQLREQQCQPFDLQMPLAVSPYQLRPNAIQVPCGREWRAHATVLQVQRPNINDNHPILIYYTEFHLLSSVHHYVLNILFSTWLLKLWALALPAVTMEGPWKGSLQRVCRKTWSTKWHLKRQGSSIEKPQKTK